MSFTGMLFRLLAGYGDKKRDAKLKAPEDVTALKDIAYADGGKYNLLDIYYPKNARGKLPVIVSIHGGGYVYGTKEVYYHYGLYLAQQGYTVVNFNYHLAPKAKFPAQLAEINQVFTWMAANAEKFHMDIENVFVVGDSAGAQLNSHYAAIYSNPEFAAKFEFTVPSEVKIRAVALNCGMYSLSDLKEKNTSGLNSDDLINDYLGKARPQKLMEQIDVLGNITSAFPPAYIMTAEYDFLKDNAEPMYEFLKEKGVPCEWKKYGEEGQNYMAHVFHVNMNLEEAKQCNQDEIAFFRKYEVK